MGAARPLPPAQRTVICRALQEPLSRGDAAHALVLRSLPVTLDCLADGKRISQPGRGTRIKSSEGRPQDLVALLLGLPPFPHQQTAQQRLPQ